MESILTKTEEKIKDFLFEELMKQTGFSRLSMDSRGEVVSEFVRTVATLRRVPIQWEDKKD